MRKSGKIFSDILIPCFSRQSRILMRGNPFRGSFASLVQDLNSIGTSKAETHRASVTHVPEKRERQRKTGKERKNKKNEERRE